MKEKLDISIGGEATAGEVGIVERAFSEHFEVTIHKGTDRPSEGGRPLRIAFPLELASPINWDSIKLSVQSLLDLLPPATAREADVKIELRLRNDVESSVLIWQNRVLLVHWGLGPESEHYYSHEEGFERLKRESEMYLRAMSDDSSDATRR